MEPLAVRAAFDRALLAELPLTTAAELEAFLGEAALIHEQRRWLPKHERIAILERTAGLVRSRREELALQIAQEGGKPLVDARVEVDRAADGIFAAAALLFQLGGREIPMGQTALTTGRFAHTYLEPRGPVAAISAFNHPLNLIVHQVVPAVASGAPVLVKPASATPLSCGSLLGILREAGLPEPYARQVLLPRDLTSRFAADARLRFFSFIGSADVGFALQKSLAPGVPAALEHGGVAPVIIDETADLELAARLVAKGGYYHAGQVCVSVQRVYVARACLGEFAERLRVLAESLVVGDPTSDQTEVGPLIRESEVVRVGEWTREAIASGARLLTGGERLSATTYAPTLLLEPPDDARVSTAEVFGPVVCLYGYDDLDDAVRRANGAPSDFQAAVFTRDVDRALDLGRRLRATAVMVNDHTAFRADWMPFGGRGPSGLGMGGIEASLRETSIERMIVFRSPCL